MSTLFGGARARASDPNIPVPEAALRLTTSVQGKARPIGWGRQRLGANLIWLGGFQPYLVAGWTPQTATSAGGKGGGHGGSTGGGTVTYTWNYLVDAIFSLAEGLVLAVVGVNSGNSWTTWSNAPTLVDPGADHFGAGNFNGPLRYATLYFGTGTQNPDATIAAQFPTQALAYRGEAYLAIKPLLLGTSASMPQMSFDCLFGHFCGLTQFPYECYPGDVILDYLTNLEYGVSGYTTDLVETPTKYNLFCGANSLLVSPVITDQIEASAFINDLLTATHSAIFMSGGQLRIRPYAEADADDNGLSFIHDATPIYDIEPQDLLPGPNGVEPIDINRKQPQEMVNNLRLEYLDRDHDYNPAIIETRDEASIAAYGIERQSDVRSHHFIARVDIASKSAALQLQREQVTTTYTFNLPREFELLDPMDLLTLPLDKTGQGQARQAVLITEIVENEDYSFTITAEEYLGTADMPIYSRQATTHNLPDFNADPGSVNPPMIFELPQLLSNGLNVYAALSGGPNWGGAEVWVSVDGVHYTFAQRVLSTARMGVTTNSIATVPGTANVVDFTNILDVDLSESRGVLNSGSADDMLTAATACYLETGEIIAYTFANLGSTYHYSLQPLLRGAYGTPILAHSAGEKFCRLDGSIAAIPYDQTRAGRKLWLKFLSFNQYAGGTQSLADATAYNYTISGLALTPEDVSTVPLDDAAVKDFVDAVNAHKDTTAAAQIAGEASAKVSTLATALSGSTGSIAELSTLVEAKFAFYDTYVPGKFVTYDAFVSSTATALASASGAQASLSTVVSAQGVSITNQQVAINQINGKMSARWSLELNVSGRITGFYLFADQTGRSDFAVQADKFQIWATGYTNKPVFEVSTIGGAAALTIDGRNLGDLSALTDAIANNAVTNGASSTGSSGGNSGTATISARTGSRIVIMASYKGSDTKTTLGFNAGLMDLTYTPPGSGPITKTFIIGAVWNSINNIAIYFSVTGVTSVSGAASGTWQASAHSYVPGYGDLSSSETTVVIQEFKK